MKYSSCHERGTMKKSESPTAIERYPPIHRASVLSTELRELMVSKAIY